MPTGETKLYGVETRRVNEAVCNNPDKFPSDYMFELTMDESRKVEIFDLRTPNSEISESGVICKACPEYMELLKNGAEAAGRSVGKGVGKSEVKSKGKSRVKSKGKMETG